MPIREIFEKQKGEWAALFAANQTRASTSTQSALNVPNAPAFGRKQQIPTVTSTVVEVSKSSEGLSKEKGTEGWK